jgi:hypothetical protein
MAFTIIVVIVFQHGTVAPCGLKSLKLKKGIFGNISFKLYGIFWNFLDFLDFFSHLAIDFSHCAWKCSYQKVSKIK